MENETIKKIIKILEKTYLSIDKITVEIIKSYYHKFKYLELEYNEHIEKEPFKFLKNKHKIWEEKKEKLEEEIDKVKKIIIEEYQDLYK